ncbi:hypothetical protein MKX01_040944 [Papaver californicum]|nr:hypothetical protein MKX01_040944 [Papaver californicum]
MDYDFGARTGPPYDAHNSMYRPTTTTTNSSSSSDHGSSLYPRVGPSGGHVKPEYRITPPPQLLPIVGEIPWSTFLFDFDFEKKVLAEADKDAKTRPDFSVYESLEHRLVVADAARRLRLPLIPKDHQSGKNFPTSLSWNPDFAIREGADDVVAVGGDGTLHEVQLIEPVLIVFIPQVWNAGRGRKGCNSIYKSRIPLAPATMMAR